VRVDEAGRGDLAGASISISPFSFISRSGKFFLKKPYIGCEARRARAVDHRRIPIRRSNFI